MDTRIELGTFVRFFAGTLLLNAAVLKLVSLSNQWLIPVILFELLLGTMMIGNLFPRTAWTLAMIAFGLFATVALWKTVVGDAQCGCLGSAVEVSPYFMFVADSALLALLARYRGCNELRSGRPLFQSPLFVPALICLCLPSVGLTYTQHRAELMDVIGEPAAWLGNRFPLRLDIDANDQIRVGRWTVVLYRSGCRTCEHLFASEDMQRLLNEASLVAYIELPPHGSPNNGLAMPHADIRGRVTGDVGLSLPAPMIIDIENGTVIQLRTVHNDRLVTVTGP